MVVSSANKVLTGDGAKLLIEAEVYRKTDSPRLIDEKD